MAKTVVLAADSVHSIGTAGLVGYLKEIIERARALPSAALETRRFEVAGQPFLARFTDKGRADLYASRLPAPRSRPGTEPAFHIDALESARLEWPRPARWHEPDGDRDDFEKALDRAGLRAAPPHAPRLWEFMDRNANMAIQLAETMSDLPAWEPGAPLRIPLHWACIDRGRRLVHGATLGDGRAAVLIAGPGGAGKSGTTLAGVAHGLQTVGDDYVVIEMGDPPVAWQAYRLLKQDRASIARVPGLAARVGASQLNWQGKLELDPELLFPGCLAISQPIRAILVPRIGSADRTRIEPIDRKLAFDALTRSTLQQFPDERASGLLFCAGLTRALPCFGVALSREAVEIGDSLAAFIEGLGR